VKRIYQNSLFFILIIFYFNFLSSAIGNNEKTSNNKKSYYEKNIVINQFNIVTKFESDVDNNCIKVKQRISYELLSLVPDRVATISEFYDKYSQINSYNGVSGENVICGSYQPEGIFHSDLKLCRYNLYFHRSNEMVKVVLNKEIQDSRFISTNLLCKNYTIRNAVLRFEIPDVIDIDLL
jgi:hypothetical protein